MGQHLFCEGEIMPRLTKEQADRLIDRARHNFQDPDERESVLQGKITQWAKDHGYPCLSFRQSKKAHGFLLPGYPDITLALPKGRVVFLELKTKKGYLSKAQKEIRQQLTYLGHEYHVVRTWKKFIEIVEEK